jgi:hypothetical protein
MLHTEAREILRSAFQKVASRSPTDLELSYSQAVAWLETLYGRGGQFASIVAKGLHNWGALETKRGSDGSCPPNTAAGRDVGDVCFYVYPTDEDAASAFLTTLLTANRTPGKSPVQADMVQAMAGSPEDVASAMKAHHYYGTAREKDPNAAAAEEANYASAIKNALASTSAPGGITDAGVVFRTSSPPGGLAPSPITPKKPWYKTTPAMGALALLGVGVVVVGVRRFSSGGRRQ